MGDDMTIRQQRRQRTRTRLQRQQRADREALAAIRESMLWSMETWGGSRCPECGKETPPRAHVDISGLYGSILIDGCDIQSQYCHKDRNRCDSEAAKDYVWRYFPAYDKYQKGKRLP
jgi:hypothetical protein